MISATRPSRLANSPSTSEAAVRWSASRKMRSSFVRQSAQAVSVVVTVRPQFAPPHGVRRGVPGVVQGVRQD